MPLRGWAQPHTCEIRAESSSTASNVTVLQMVTAICGEMRVWAPSAHWSHGEVTFFGPGSWVQSPEGRLDPLSEMTVTQGAIVIPFGCLQSSETPTIRCCGHDIQRSESGWLLGETSCSVPAEGVFTATAVQWTATAITLEGESVGAPLSIPYPGSDLDSTGRRSGFTAPVFGYDSERGGRLRQDWYQTLGDQADATFGGYAETSGVGGIVGEFRLASARPDSSRFSWLLAYDSGSESEVRLWTDSDFALTNEPANLGLVFSGQLRSDPYVSSDFSTSTLVGQRPDQHINSIGWTGGANERFWLGTSFVGIGVRPDDEPQASNLDILGTLPTAGYAHRLVVADAIELTNSLRFDRYELGAPASPHVLNGFRLLVGGQLRPPVLPGLLLVPGTWLETSSTFSDPGTDTLYRRLGTRLISSLIVSSPWVGGGPSLWHLIELRGVFRLETFRRTQIEGVASTVPAMNSFNPPLQISAHFDNTLRAEDWELAVPISWRHFQWDIGSRSRFLGEVRFSLDLGSVELAFNQEVDFDVDDSKLCCWANGVTTWIRLGQLDPPLPDSSAETRIGFEGELSSADSGAQLWRSYRLASVPFLQSPALASVREESLNATTRLHFSHDWLGASSYLIWPFDVEDDPDWGVALWLGRVDDFRFLAQADFLNDGTWSLAATLVQGNTVPVAGWFDL